jgi:hypothetical protein
MANYSQAQIIIIIIIIIAMMSYYPTRIIYNFIMRTSKIIMYIAESVETLKLVDFRYYEWTKKSTPG